MQNKSLTTKILIFVLSLTITLFFTACSNENGSGGIDGNNVSDSAGDNGNDSANDSVGDNSSDSAGDNGSDSDSVGDNGNDGDSTGENSIDSMTLDEIMDAIYASISDVELPKLVRTEITDDNAENFLGTPSVEFTEGLASEPMMSAIAHSVCLIRVADDADVDSTLQLIRDNAKPGKWICVMVEDQYVYVEKNGNVIALIMVNDYAPQMAQAFTDIK